jgi:cyclophilin family peptidyl-prolyl cis-trans isomerase/HEAT repeat protein
MAATVLVAQQSGGLSTAAPVIPAVTIYDVLLAADRIRADRWYPTTTTLDDSQAATGEHNRASDLDLLLAAAAHPDLDVRVTAIRELGRFETPQNIAFLAAHLHDGQLQVRQAAADAIVQSTVGHSDAEAQTAVSVLEERLIREALRNTRAYLWEALAELPLPEYLAGRLEQEWMDEIEYDRPLRLQALAALGRMVRRTAERRVSARTEATIVRLAETGLRTGDENVMVGTVSRGPTLAFLRIARDIRTDDAELAELTARFSCRKSLRCGEEIRLFGVDWLNPTNERHLTVLEEVARRRTEPVLSDAAARKLARGSAVPVCRLLELTDGTPGERDVVASMREGTTNHESCGDWDPATHLLNLASELVSSVNQTTWLVPRTAMETLATYKNPPDALRRIVSEVAVVHPRWEVRVGAVRAAQALKDQKTLSQLMLGSHPVVKAEALKAMFAIEAGDRWAQAIELLAFPDPYVRMTAASFLRAIPAPAVALEPLMLALSQLTAEERDTNRRVRLTILDTLDTLLRSSQDTPGVERWIDAIARLATDSDPKVAERAALMASRLSSRSVPARPTRVRPQQPTVVQLMALPPCVTLAVDGAGDWTVVLDRRRAPLASARFVMLVNSNQLANTTLYRVTDRLVVGGNRNGHDEGGLSRFIRDEVGGEYAGPQLVLLGHERDELDGRFAIRLESNPSRIRQETTLGQVVGFRPVDEGTTVTRATVGAPAALRERCSLPPGIPPLPSVMTIRR